MKKILFAIAIIIGSCFASCGSKTSETNDASNEVLVDTCTVDSVICDSIVCDSIIAE